MIEDASRVLARTFKHEGADLVLLGEDRGELGGSEYLKVVHGQVAGQPPHVDLSRERALIELLVNATAAGLLQSAHDCSDGGLAVTLAECTFGAGIGLEVDVPRTDDHRLAGSRTARGLDAVTALFSESAARVVVSVAGDQREALLHMAAQAGVPAQVIGRTGGSRLRMRVGGEDAIDLTVAEAEQIWGTAIERYFKRTAA